MRAFAFEEYGGPEVIKEMDLPMPEVGDNDVLIEVENTGISPYDIHVRDGDQAGKRENPLPFILGWDISGFVREVGTNVTDLKSGDEVIAIQDLERHGGYAEFVSVAQETVVKKPKDLSFEEAAVIPINALTVYQVFVEKANLSKGEKVLIHGGAGGVGVFAIQLAKELGAYVATTASEHNHAFLKMIGADEVIDYNKVDFAEVISDYDVVLDTRGGATLDRSYGVVKKGGHVISIRSGQIDKDEAKKRNIQAYFHDMDINREDLIEVVNLYGEGKIKAYFDTIYPLSEVRAAHKRSEAGHARGKIVLKIKA